ncbi:rhodanese-like domain-containing protein [uncultured Thiothrix sp.]|uniref:rhodanese-like domain-containing protein n=1 Tax=uncultured Thiothrix sp. TaxID=223185 RepID=UPI0026094B7E|nr:rhodanese-like domain-containing protein [uncultured Thiothrix sp.]
MNLPINQAILPAASALPLEISALTAREMCKLYLACLIDIRQGFELEIKGNLPQAMHIPFFNVKQFFGFSLTDEEQEMLDADEPSTLDICSFIKAINTLQQARDCSLLVVCNSGRRSQCATQLLRELGYSRTFSVAGGFLALKPLYTSVD